MKLQKYIVFLLLLLLGNIQSIYAQYGNEWIVASQTYYKIPTAQNGFYALTYSDLQNAGVNMGIDPRRFQLWHRGVEQNILIKGESDGQFNTNDSLIFYGKVNDGFLDKNIYQTPSLQPHNYYNLYNDTTAFFLTWNSSTSNKRMPLNPNNLVFSPEPYHIAEYLNVYTDEYSRGREYGEATQSYGDLGEGWFGTPFTTTFSQSVPLPDLVTSGSDIRIEVMIVGRNNISSRVVRLTVGNLNVADVTSNFLLFSQQDVSKLVLTIPASQATNGSLNLTIDASSQANNRIAMAYIKVNYPQSVVINTAGSKLISPASTATPLYYATSVPSGFNPEVFNLTDLNNIELLRYTYSSGTLAIFSPASTTLFCIQNTNSYLRVPSIRQVDMSPYNLTSNYLILTHQLLMNEAQEYANYRTSLAGGGFNVLIAEVNKVYNMYGYGEYTPVAIKRFCFDQIDNNPKQKSLFIIGKGLDLMFGQYFPTLIYYRKNPSFFINNTNPDFKLQNFVPPFGSPSSDIYYVMNSSSRPGMSVGRHSAKTNQEVIDYLDKVKEHEQLDSNYLWRKKLIHLSGGADAGQVSLFRQYVNGYKTIVENSKFGGKVVKSYVKDLNSGSVDNIQITEDVNEGLGYITFFGHSSANITELDIGFVSKDIFGYRNKGKYPMLIINGCNSANAYFNYSMGEDWLHTRDRGAIAVLGVSDIGYTSPLDNYTSSMYRAMFDTDSLRLKPAAYAMKVMLNIFSFDNQTAHQMNFHGDPQIKIYNPSKPDYEISGDKETRADKPELKCFFKSFDGKKVTASTDSFQIGIPVKNFGVYDNDKYFIQVIRTVNGKDIRYKEVQYNPVRFVDTLFFTIKDNNKSSNFGLNKFLIILDSRDTIHEMDETNNTATLEYFMSSSAVTCLFPKKYSVVKAQPVTFVAQSTNLLIDQKEYYFELDTTYKFNSGFKKTTTITSGSLVKWPNINLYTDNSTDSIVYYWRVRLKNIVSGEDTLWDNSSFIYIKNSNDGWSQSEAPQFTESVLSNIKLDLADSTWKFLGSSMPLVLKVFGNGDGDDFDSTIFKVGDIEAMFPGYWYFWCGPPTGSRGATENVSYRLNGMVAISINKNTVQNYPIPGYPLCGRFPKPIINPFYTSDAGWQNNFKNWLDAIPPGDFILIGSNGNAHFDSWPAALKNTLTNDFGAQKVSQLNDNEPYILLARKGGTSPIKELHSDNTLARLLLDTLLTGTFNNGTITSTRIGPATKWGTFYQRIYSSGQDKHKFKVLGERLNGTLDTLNLNLTFAKNASGIDTIDLNPLIDANVYPYLRLYCAVYDSSVALDPPQLNRWQVIYNKSPEGTMNPFVAGLENYNVTTKDEGAKVCIPYVFENISDVSFGDSLFVRISAKGETSVSRDTSFVVYRDSLKQGQSFNFTYCLNTKGLSGNVTMRTFVNPNIQPEEYYTNNVIETNFEVIKDRIPPIIDVMFDGVHIMDGDLVSPSPLITIVLNDNSRYLLITDPNDLSIFFKTPGSSEVQILPTNPDIIRYGQSPGNGNRFTIEFNPKDLPDGEYTIIVQGKDVNGNKSGQYYKVTFRVENASTISNFFPYPNPFSTSTRFVFTLSGRYIPDDLKIQILTVSGKVVREIMKEELGHIHIGNNKTDYAWDGTDEFGDKLANGVYLYRVIIKNKGDNFDHRETAGDKAFKKEFGKLYILR